MTLGTYLRVMAEFGLQSDLGRLAENDVEGNRLRDAELEQQRAVTPTL